ncbi:helix-turn-helix domain-containing protein [Chryseobacterium tongliaoense]|uniref:helix-turn-helix domain-containing protein n=1 Tax=Chryseobacterium tongliaoense TaxID=3240933 RepID=UPI0035167A25
MKQPVRLKTITEFHRFRGLEKPEHPLISVVDYSTIRNLPENTELSWILDFYSISIKRTSNTRIKYGQQEYDFDEGVMFFMAPGQVFSITADPDSTIQHSGWILLIHSDFLWNTSLAKTIKQYEYFDYAVNEALFLSEKEETLIHAIVQNIQQEYHSNIDQFSQNIIISQIETLLNYAERFYQRQFITRKITNHKILDSLENLLTDYFNHEDLITKGLPTVQYIANELNVSPSYLTGLLKVLTGQNTQQHIHEKLIEKAKEKLSTTQLSVGEIAYELGFEHPQSFSKLFKNKTDLSPLEFRQSFN